MHEVLGDQHAFQHTIFLIFRRKQRAYQSNEIPELLLNHFVVTNIEPCKLRFPLLKNMSGVKHIFSFKPKFPNRFHIPGFDIFPVQK